MSIILLYLLLLKATATSFSGLGSLPVIRGDLVVARHLITDEQLNAAVAVGRTTPGPAGLYVVSVGYLVAGVPGAIAGWFALITPSLLVILLIYLVKRKGQNPRLESALQAVMLASAGLILASALPLAREAVTGPFLALIAVSSCLILTVTKIQTIWVIVGAAGLSLGIETVRLIVKAIGLN